MVERIRDAASVSDTFIDQVTESGRYCFNGGSGPVDRAAFVLEPCGVAAEHALVTGHRMHGLVPLLSSLYHALELVPHLRPGQCAVAFGVTEQELSGFPGRHTYGVLAGDLTGQITQEIV